MTNAFDDHAFSVLSRIRNQKCLEEIEASGLRQYIANSWGHFRDTENLMSNVSEMSNNLFILPKNLKA